MRHLHLFVLSALLAAACGGKSAPAAPANAEATPPAEECCCAAAADPENSDVTFVTPDACAAQGGVCTAENADCHGIEGPIP